MGAHIGFDRALAGLDDPFVQPLGRIMDIAVEEAAMIGIEHDLPDGGAGAFGHDAIDETVLSLSVIQVPGNPILAPFMRSSLIPGRKCVPN